MHTPSAAAHPEFYTVAQHETWRAFFADHQKSLKQHANAIHPAYLAHLGRLEAFKDGVPSLDDINKVLAPTGFVAQYADGYAPPWEVTRMLAQGVIPVSRHVRPAEELHFASEPDLLHDVFGHIPPLFDSNYRRLLRYFAATACRATVMPGDLANFHLNKSMALGGNRLDPQLFMHLKAAQDAIQLLHQDGMSAVQIFDKLYFWIFEFGMFEDQGALKVLGAGLISSLGELQKVSTKAASFLALTPKTLQAPYNFTAQQDAYLVAPSFAYLYELIDMMGADQASTALKRGQHA